MKLLASIMSLVLVLSLCACSRNEGRGAISDKKEKNDELVTVYLLSSETSYNADGSNGRYRYEYTYDSKGNMLSERKFNGSWEIPEEDRTYTYNENGQIYNNGQAEYQYNDNGTISAVKVYFANPQNTYEGDGEYVTYRYSYDDYENLTGVEMVDVDNTVRTIASYKYDENLRLLEEKYASPAIYYNEFTLYVSRYTYNSQGDIAQVERLVGTSYDGVQEPELTQKMTVGYTYDNSGKLLSRSYYIKDQELERYTCEYNKDGTLSKVTDNAYATDQTNVYEYCYKNGRVDVISLTYGSRIKTYYHDENGNIIRRKNDDGSYVVYEYLKIQLPAEEAVRCERVQGLRFVDRVINVNYHNRLPRVYDVRNEFLSMIAYPVDALYQVDMWIR